MGSWDDYKRTCFHGRREGLDSHECGRCQEVAERQGLSTAGGKTYIFVKDPEKKVHPGDVKDGFSFVLMTKKGTDSFPLGTFKSRPKAEEFAEKHLTSGTQAWWLVTVPSDDLLSE